MEQISSFDALVHCPETYRPPRILPPPTSAVTAATTDISLMPARKGLKQTPGRLLPPLPLLRDSSVPFDNLLRPPMSLPNLSLDTHAYLALSNLVLANLLPLISFSTLAVLRFLSFDPTSYVPLQVVSLARFPSN